MIEISPDVLELASIKSTVEAFKETVSAVQYSVYKQDDYERTNPLGDPYNACYVGFIDKLAINPPPVWLRFKFLQNKRPNLKVKFLMDVYSVFSNYFPHAKMFLAKQDLKNVLAGKQYSDILPSDSNEKYLCYEFLIDENVNPVLLFIYLNVVRMAQEYFYIWANKDVFRLKDVHKELLTFAVEKGPGAMYNYGHLHLYPVRALTELDKSTNIYLGTDNKLYKNHETLVKLVPKPIRDLKQLRVACDRWGRLFDYSFKEGRFNLNEVEEKRVKTLLVAMGKPLQELTLKGYVEKKINISYGGATETVSNILAARLEEFMKTDAVIVKEQQEKEFGKVDNKKENNEKVNKKKKENKE